MRAQRVDANCRLAMHGCRTINCWTASEQLCRSFTAEAAEVVLPPMPLPPRATAAATA